MSCLLDSKIMALNLCLLYFTRIIIVPAPFDVRDNEMPTLYKFYEETGESWSTSSCGSILSRTILFATSPPFSNDTAPINA